MVMPNYQGNPLGGIKLSGPEQQAAASSFQILTGGMGLGALLGDGTGGNVPLLSSASTDPVLSSLALAGSESPLAVLMGGGSAGNDPAALLASLVGSNAISDAGVSSAPTPQEKIEEAAVEALSNRDFARMLIRSEPTILQKIVKLLATTGAGGGGAVG
jgi:hypothetical protein